MREIKFRAWNDREKTMQYSIMEIFSQITDDADNILMQYTGLKDKNGKEIYDGDIVEIEDGKKYAEKDTTWNYQYKAVVEWKECCFDLDRTISSFKYGGHDLYFLADKVEVIGNIYEDQSLIK